MRLLIVSDSHGDYKSIMAVLRLLGRSVQGLVHLGDGSGDVRDAFRTGVPVIPYWGVKGNVDSDSKVPLFRQIEAGGKKILLAHGHRYPLGQDLYSLVRIAKEAKANAFFYGHTHIPHYEERSGIVLMNPGSISRPRGPWGPSFAIIEASPLSSYLDVKIYELFIRQQKASLRAIHL